MRAPKSWLSVDRGREALVFRLTDGTPVVTHYSFFLVALLMTAPLLLQGVMAKAIVGAALVVVMYVSILAHELGHRAAARRQGAHTSEIEIGAWGGLAHLVWDERRGIAMRPVAFAGPLANIQLAGLFYALYWLAGHLGPSDATPFGLTGNWASASQILHRAFVLNVGLAVFNLLPGYPLDGSVIAEETFGAHFGLRRARLLIGLCGLAIASVGVVLAFAMAMAGMPLLVWVSFAQNWQAIKENWRAPDSTSQALPERVTSVIQFKNRGGRL